MHYRNASPRMWGITLLLLVASTVYGKALNAQEVSAPAAVVAAPAPAATVDVAPAAPATTPAGPRIVPPLERYETALPGARADAAPMASGSNHTIVLSTLALILVVVIVVLLAVK